MVTRDAHAKILDFGLAKLADPTESTLTPAVAGVGVSTMTQPEIGAIKGTPAYMSPEQIRADAVGARSDLFFLGVMLFEMATGEAPFRRETPLEPQRFRLAQQAQRNRLKRLTRPFEFLDLNQKHGAAVRDKAGRILDIDPASREGVGDLEQPAWLVVDFDRKHLDARDGKAILLELAIGKVRVVHQQLHDPKGVAARNDDPPYVDHSIGEYAGHVRQLARPILGKDRQQSDIAAHKQCAVGVYELFARSLPRVPAPRPLDSFLERAPHGPAASARRIQLLSV